MEFPVYRQDGSEAGRSVSLSASIFGIQPNDHVIWLDVKATQANARQGTHKVKDRGENSHSTRKLYRQKGTGGSRAGSAKSPIRRGGGTIFGPRPRNYTQNVNRKTKQLATRSALAYKAQEGAIRVIDAIALDAPKTRDINTLVGTLGLTGRTVFVTDTTDRSLLLSIRNLPKVHVQTAASLSTLDVMQATTLVFLEGALSALDSRFEGAKEVKSGDGAEMETSEPIVTPTPVIKTKTKAPAVTAEPVIDTDTEVVAAPIIASDTGLEAIAGAGADDVDPSVDPATQA